MPSYEILAQTLDFAEKFNELIKVCVAFYLLVYFFKKRISKIFILVNGHATFCQHLKCYHLVVFNRTCIYKSVESCLLDKSAGKINYELEGLKLNKYFILNWRLTLFGQQGCLLSELHQVNENTNQP